MAKEKLLGVQWIARSYLGDTELMDKDVEGTYFRILNYIYLTQDRLPDDDAKLWRLTKCRSIREYRAHKAELLKPRGFDPETGQEIPARLILRVEKDPTSEGTSDPTSKGKHVTYICSPKCTLQLGKSSKFRHAKSRAGKASAEAAKGRKTKETGARTVATGQSTDGSTERQHSGQQKPQHNGQRSEASVAHNLKGYPSDNHPLTPSDAQTSAGSGCADAPPARPPAPPQGSHDDRVEVDVGGGVIFAINSIGLCEHIGGPLDAEVPTLTPKRALEMRAAAISKPGATDDFDPERDRPAFMRAESRAPPANPEAA